MQSLKDNLEITFVSTVPGLTSIPECLPQSTKKFIPEWWKKLPYTVPRDNFSFPGVLAGVTIKACPAFPEYFSQGVVLPMWTDTLLRYNEKESIWTWKTSDPIFAWDVHSSKQLTDHKKPVYQGKTSPFVFKAISPWRAITPPGVSLYQFPVFYDFNEDFSVLPGIIRTDVWHTLNQQVLFHSSKEEIFIKRGTPFVHYIPFVRQDTVLNIRDADTKDTQIFSDLDRLISTKFIPNKQYVNLLKNSKESELDNE